MKIFLRTRRVLGLGILFLTFACGGTDQPEAEPGSAQSPLPAGHPAIPDALPADSETLEGVILEAMESGGYTYARIETADGEVWAAGPVTPLEEGTAVKLIGASDMGEFTSTSLGRTFDQLFFVGSFTSDGPPPASVSGLAVQVIAGGGYTYVEAEVEGGKRWLAGPETEVAEGQTVFWVGGTEMGPFTSPTLGRIFEQILFVDRFWVEG